MERLELLALRPEYKQVITPLISIAFRLSPFLMNEKISLADVKLENLKSKYYFIYRKYIDAYSIYRYIYECAIKTKLIPNKITCGEKLIFLLKTQNLINDVYDSFLTFDEDFNFKKDQHIVIPTALVQAFHLYKGNITQFKKVSRS